MLTSVTPWKGAIMTEDAKPRTLIVANRTSSTPVLLAVVKQRAAAGERFALMVPPERPWDHHDWTLEEAAQLVEEACEGAVDRLEAGSDAAETIKALVEERRAAAIIVSTTPVHLAGWVHLDLPHRVQDLGVPVVVIPHEADAPIPVEFPDNWIGKHPLAGTGGY
jgi:hypothetical protein